MTRLLVVNGDDFGLARGVNEGIIEAHTQGILTSASLMVLTPAATDAARLARAHPALSVGLHFAAGDADLDDPAQTERAFREQLDRFRELVGHEPTHVDSHHHVHVDHMTSFKALVEPLGVPLRGDGHVSYLGDFWGQPDADHIKRDFLLRLVESEVGEGFTELGCHPARITEDLRSSYLDERALELQTLTSPGLRQELESRGVTLVSFQAWRTGAGTR